MSASAWSLYGGMAFALTGTITSDGWRLRAASAYGSYRYGSLQWDGRERQERRFRGDHASADLMLGYRYAFGPVIAKIYAGAAYESHAVHPFDEENLGLGSRAGLKVLVETWTTLGQWGFVQTDASWSGPFSTFAARIRGGYRLNPGWSAGPEIAAFGTEDYAAGRIGAFVRYEWARAEVSASAGISDDRDHAAGGYGTASVLLRF